MPEAYKNLYALRGIGKRGLLDGFVLTLKKYALVQLDLRCAELEKMDE